MATTRDVKHGLTRLAAAMASATALVLLASRWSGSAVPHAADALGRRGPLVEGGAPVERATEAHASAPLESRGRRPAHVALPEGVGEAAAPIAGPDSGTSLRVVDAADETDVSLVEVRVAGRASSGHAFHPASSHDAETIVRGATSPIALRPLPGTHAYWVSARGYAWTRVAIRSGTPIGTVRLRRAGVVSVRIEGAEEDAELVLRWTRADGLGGAAVSLAVPPEGEAALDRVAPGRYGLALMTDVSRVSGRVGPRTLDERTFEVPSGADVGVVLSASRRERDTGTLEGALTVDGPPSDAVPSITVARRGERGEPGLLRVDPTAGTPATPFWSVPGLRAGEYEVVVEPFGWSRVVEVLAGQTTYLPIDLTELARVRVWALAEDRGDAVELEFLGWKGTRSGSLVATPGKRISSEDGAVTFFTAETSVDLFAFGPGHVGRLEDVALLPGPNDVHLEMTPLVPRSVRIELRDAEDGSPVLAPPGWWARLDVRAQNPRDGVEVLHWSPTLPDGPPGSSLDAAEATVMLHGRGDVRIAFPALESYAVPAAVTVAAPGPGPAVPYRVLLSRR